MINFDKEEVREQLTLDNIFELLEEWGGDPQYSNSGLISTTICHNSPGEGSRKLYYYEDSKLFYCFTGCEEPTFDIFQLLIKVAEIQYNQDYDLNDSVRWIANYFGISGVEVEDEEERLEDWKILAEYDRINDIIISARNFILKTYDPVILERMNYKIKIKPWLEEHISQEIMNLYRIGYYPAEDQITIPHYDINNNFIGLRGRSMCEEDCKRYGKYRPIRANNITYSHPLGMNLYGLNMNKDNIRQIRKAIIFESEKSVLKYGTFFGQNSNISVAVCGSHVSAYQMQLLFNLGVQEVTIAFDRQFKFIGDTEWRKLKKNLLKIGEKYKKDCNISLIVDIEKITNYKSSPIDESPDKFIRLFNKRILV